MRGLLRFRAPALLNAIHLLVHEEPVGAHPTPSMTRKKQPEKPAAAAAPKKAAAKPRAKTAAMPTAPKPESIPDQVRRQYGAAISKLSVGWSAQAVGESMSPPMTGAQLRLAFRLDDELRELLKAAKEECAHHFVELAGHAAIEMVAMDAGSDKKGGAEMLLKIAAKYAPEVYGDKSVVSVTGKNGGPIEVTHMTDEMLAKIAAGKSAA